MAAPSASNGGSSIPTESRIFADRFLREQRSIERRQAARLIAGHDAWPSALSAYGKKFWQAGSPAKRSAMAEAVCDRFQLVVRDKEVGEDVLRSTYPMQVSLKRRSGMVAFLTFSVSNLHPYGLDERRDGLAVHLMILSFNRSGDLVCSPQPVLVTYICHHALARLHERYGVGAITAIGGFATAAYLGTLGFLLAPFETHRSGEICFAIGDVIFVGAMREGVKSKAVWFLDVRTALPGDSPSYADKLMRGRATAETVLGYLTEGGDIRELARAIPIAETRTCRAP